MEIKENEHYKIWDGLFDDVFLHELDLDLSNTSFWGLGNVANSTSYPYGLKGSHNFWGATLYRENANIFKVINETPQKVQDLFYFLKSKIDRDFKLLEISLNAQSLGQDGGWHLDHYASIAPPEMKYNEDYTMMLFLNPIWEKDWGGEFQFTDRLEKSSKPLITLDYTPGRVILFKGIIPHRGLGPKVSKVVRKTLVFRLGVI